VQVCLLRLWQSLQNMPGTCIMNSCKAVGMLLFARVYLHTPWPSNSRRVVWSFTCKHFNTHVKIIMKYAAVPLSLYMPSPVTSCC
jgi:hypothetical protein